MAVVQKSEFVIVDRPAPRVRGGRPRSAAVVAVLDTVKTGKAIEFVNEATARSVRFTAASILKREAPELQARRDTHSVWVEARGKKKGKK